MVRLLMIAAAISSFGNAAADSRGVRPLSTVAEKPLEPFDPMQSAALFVGVRHFPYDKTLAEVRYAVDDAIDLACVLALDERAHLVHPSRVILALSGDPQKPESRRNLERLVAAGVQIRSAGGPDILNALDEQARAVGSRGVLVLAFATHGFSWDGTQYLLTATSILRHRASTISENEIRDIASQSEAARSLILVDACRERLTEGRRSNAADPESAAPLLRAMGGVHGQVVLSAAAAGQYAYDDDDRRNGVFTAAVIDGLRCQASADAYGLITAETLSSFVEKRVLTWIRKNRNSRATRATQVSSEGSAKAMPLAECGSNASVVRDAPAAVVVSQPMPAPARSASAKERTLHVVGEDGQLIPELVVAARTLDDALSLTAKLETSTSPPNDLLQGLITTYTSLQVSITRDGRLVNAFTLQSTGAGFTQGASTQQAHERLAATLSQRLAQEHP